MAFSNTSFLFMTELCAVAWMYPFCLAVHQLDIWSLTSLAVMNNAYMNIYVQVFVGTSV